MAGKPSKPMTPFDKSVTPSYLYKWKLFLAFLPPSIQRFLAVHQIYRIPVYDGLFPGTSFPCIFFSIDQRTCALYG